MAIPDSSSKSQYSPMSKRSKTTSFDGFIYLGGALLAFFLLWSLYSYALPHFTPTLSKSSNSAQFQPSSIHNLRLDPPGLTFYDDPDLRYSIEKPIKDWDQKRKNWLAHHPSFQPGAAKRVVMVTGSQSKPCKNPIGDHLLLRLFKNKVDYCRIHNIDIYYNNVHFHPKMNSYWTKLPTIKSAMLAHPEAEWIWWVDSDAAITDMEFVLPLERYDFKNHNIVVHGWANMIYRKQSWTALNAGVFLIRNCQWSMDFMDKWANMGPMSNEYKKWGKVQRELFKDKLYPESDDQSALIYLLYKDRSLTEKIYLEGEYNFEGYWLGIVPTFGNITEKYIELEREDGKLRRRHAEKVSEQYGAYKEPYLKDKGSKSWKRPFITHFTGCQPCSGDHNQMYTGESCYNGMVKALNFANNQVLRNYGFMHPDLLDSDMVSELPFDYPDEGPW